MNRSDINAWQTRPIPRWQEPATSDVSNAFGHDASALEWEANYLLPQVVGAAEHVIKRLTFNFANRSDRHEQR
jgi:hypothetical protein